MTQRPFSTLNAFAVNFYGSPESQITFVSFFFPPVDHMIVPLLNNILSPGRSTGVVLVVHLRLLVAERRITKLKKIYIYVSLDFQSFHSRSVSSEWSC